MRDGGGEALAPRLRRHVEATALIPEGGRVLVALSGGVDSVVLLHVLRFAPPVDGLELVAAHLDHGMRPGSGADAHWVRGLARAWDVPCRQERAEPTPRGETRAREVRYEFLHRVRREVGADLVVTAHHADDQAETVLFRAARGTGVAGLRGIPPRSAGGVVRPLLPFWREELMAYARARGLRWRDDPSNRSLGHPRNVVRHRVLPELEEKVAPGARRALVRLARLAREDEAAWGHVVRLLLDQVRVEGDDGRTVVDRDGLLAHPPPLRARLLRALVKAAGMGLDEAGTRAAMEFTSRGSSGKALLLPGGVRLTREFDRIVVTPPSATPEQGASASLLEIPGPGAGGGTFGPGGRAYRVCWDVKDVKGGGEWGRVEQFSLEDLTFPLRLRGWVAGDRIRLAYGRKKLKKLFAERRIPAGDREGQAVLSDGDGRVLWVPGVARSVLAPSTGGGGALIIGIEDAEHV